MLISFKITSVLDILYQCFRESLEKNISNCELSTSTCIHGQYWCFYSIVSPECTPSLETRNYIIASYAEV